MNAFKFRLDAVLTAREQAEQAAQQMCARAYAAVETALADVRAAESAIDTAEQAHRAQLAAGPRAGQLEQSLAYTVLLHERRLELERKLAEVRRQAETARRQLLAATQQREALERVRSRQKRTHDYETARAEQRILDDCVGRGPALSKAWKEGVAEV
jgi:flagellar export protein FliJ